MSKSAVHIRLRKAVVADVPMLEGWDRQPHVIAATGSGDEGFSLDWRKEIPRAVAWRELLIAEADGRPVGCIQIIDPATEETHYWGNAAPNQRAIDIWIGAASDLGRGYGSQMMALAFKRCFGAPAVTMILIDPMASNMRAIKFYKGLGFKPMGRRRFDEDLCLVMTLSRTDWQKRYGAGRDL